MSQQAIPILTLTVTATGTIAANRFVTPAGLQVAADANAIGVTRAAAVANDKIPVDVLGTTIVEAGAAISAGATLKSDSTGRAITWVTAGARLGIALEATTAAGQFFEAMLIPNAA